MITKNISFNNFKVKGYTKKIKKILDDILVKKNSVLDSLSSNYKNSYNKKINVINDGGDSQIVFGEDYNRNFFISKGLIEYKGELEI